MMGMPTNRASLGGLHPSSFPPASALLAKNYSMGGKFERGYERNEEVRRQCFARPDPDAHVGERANEGRDWRASAPIQNNSAEKKLKQTTLRETMVRFHRAKAQDRGLASTQRDEISPWTGNHQKRTEAHHGKMKPNDPPQTHPENINVVAKIPNWGTNGVEPRKSETAASELQEKKIGEDFLSSSQASLSN